MTAMRLAVVLVLVLAVSACGGDRSTDPSDPPNGYTPVADEVLFAEIARLPGVVSADLQYTDTFANPNVYGGTITVAPGEDPRSTLDHAIAILRQGHRDAVMALYAKAVDGQYRYGANSLGLGSTDTYAERYGPQPGDGKPPDEPLPPLEE